MGMPIHAVGNRTDFMFDGKPHVGQVIAVIEGPRRYGVQFEHQYVMQDSGGQRYRIAESNLSTPYGAWDD